MATTRFLSGFGSTLDWRPLQFVDHMPDIRICNLCGIVARMTMLLPCSHVLCKVCYGQVKDKNQSCPVDRKKIIEEQVQTLELKEDQLDDRRVLCLNSRRGCSFMGTITDFKEHIEHDCDYYEVSCPKCGSSVTHMKILEHCLGSCVEGTISIIPNANESVLGDLQKIRLSLDDALEGMSQKKVAVQGKVNGLVECLDGYTSQIKSLQGLLRDAIDSSQLARVHIPPALADGKRSGCAAGAAIVDRTYICLSQIYKRKSSLSGGVSTREVSPACILAGYSLMVESKFAEKDQLLHLEFGVMFCAGSWDSFVSWPFSRQVTLTLVHPADERRNMSLPVSVPEDTERFECVKKPSPDGVNAAMRTRSVVWNQLELSGFIANDSLCISIEME
ncbi:uncharacterized protein [Dermacentor andersoni]|uniref:uncharacterized protein n=1 Tax=Dermacentor andersoni TaxID=34620 RepID=UPI002155CC87|nr:uncharacterized protein LOC126529981 [Dermacentor andersoni]XP_054926140.1 uncharacterized protein LOC126529981 [Dermacentor andersoni]